MPLKLIKKRGDNRDEEEKDWRRFCTDNPCYMFFASNFKIRISRNSGL